MLKLLNLNHQKRYVTIEILLSHPYRGTLGGFNNKEYKMENELSKDLSIMLDSAMKIAKDEKVSTKTVNAAEDCIQSLLKSMAVLGYNKINNKEIKK